MHKGKSALFIVNKYSGGGYRPEVEGNIIEQCKNLGIESIIEFTQAPGHAIELARNAAVQSIDFVFAVGGDGTVNEVAQGLIGSTVAMGILPKGSGNGLARHIGMPMSFKKSLTILYHHRVQQIDTLLVNNKMSVNVSGIGFDGHIASLFANNVKRGLGGYAKLIAKEYMDFTPFEAVVHVKGESIQFRSFIIALANSSQFGNNARVAPQASVCDQLIDVSILKKVPMVELIGFAGKMFLGNLHRSKFVQQLQTDQLTIRLRQPMAYHVDGEAMPSSDFFVVRIQPRSLNVLLPLGQSKV